MEALAKIIKWVVIGLVGCLIAYLIFMAVIFSSFFGIFEKAMDRMDTGSVVIERSVTDFG